MEISKPWRMLTLWLRDLENKESQDKPIGVIERPEEQRIEDKPIAKKSVEIKESE